jgi:hypothetical protein
MADARAEQVRRLGRVRKNPPGMPIGAIICRGYVGDFLMESSIVFYCFDA